MKQFASNFRQIFVVFEIALIDGTKYRYSGNFVKG